MAAATRMDARITQGEPRLLLDINALATNLRALRRSVAATVKLCAVVKADAYGHSASLIASLIDEIEQAEPFLNVHQYAVATIDEARQIHEFGKPIMILRPIENAFIGRQRELIEHAIQSGWTMTLASAGAADDIARIAIHLQKRANVQIMIDTGMTRCGTSDAAFDGILERTLHHASLKLAGVSTHLVSSDVAGDPITAKQLRSFNAVVDRHPILESVPKHAANSGGIFLAPRSHYDLVRAGISLYGIDPTGRPSTDRPLAPVMKWTAPIIAIHHVETGCGVGYGHTWLATTPSRIATVPVGYADGYPRSAGNRSVVMVQDKPCGVVGRVSMDMLAVDITRVPETTIGDEVTLVDSNPLSPASIYALATIAGTIPYELLTRIGPRVKRVAPHRTTDDDEAALSDEEM